MAVDSPDAPETGSEDPDLPDDGTAEFEPHSEVLPMSTKPSQLPSGGSSLPGGPMADPSVVPMTTDPVAEGIETVSRMIAEQNPDADLETVRRVARKVVARLVVEGDFDPLSMVPMIEDPLANRLPGSFDFKKKKDKKPDGEKGSGEDGPAPGSSLPDPWPLPDLTGPPEIDRSEIPDLSRFDVADAGKQVVERGAENAVGKAVMKRLPMLLV